jgi:hypothetical protein
MEFSYTSRAPNITATFAVIWGGSKPLDNPDNVHGMFQKLISKWNIYLIIIEGNCMSLYKKGNMQHTVL